MKTENFLRSFFVFQRWILVEVFATIHVDAGIDRCEETEIRDYIVSAVAS